MYFHPVKALLMCNLLWSHGSWTDNCCRYVTSLLPLHHTRDSGRSLFYFGDVKSFILRLTSSVLDKVSLSFSLLVLGSSATWSSCLRAACLDVTSKSSAAACYKVWWEMLCASAKKEFRSKIWQSCHRMFGGILFTWTWFRLQLKHIQQ